MSDDLKDLVAFLGASKPEVRRAAADIVAGLTGSPEGVDKLRAQEVPLLAGLLRLATEPDEALAVPGLSALVNLSQEPGWAAALLRFNAVGRVMEYVRDKACAHLELLLMLLVNMTVNEQGAQELLQLGKPGMAGLNMALLLRLFVTSAVTLLPGTADPYAHIASLLVNASRLQAGRQTLLTPGRGTLQALAAQLAPGVSLPRRRGCAGAIRNCCISAEADGTLSELLADEAVLARLLRPLGGTCSSSSSSSSSAAAAGANGHSAAAANGVPQPHGGAANGAPQANGSGGVAADAASSSGRDPDELVRAAVAEAVAALAATDAGRKALWKVSAPELLKSAYEDEEAPEVCAAMEAAARCFMFDADASALAADDDDGDAPVQPAARTVDAQQ